MQAKQKKNVETDVVGDKVGRIHLGRQDLGNLQTRKMKGLKRGRDGDDEVIREDGDDVTMVDGSGDDNDMLKKPRRD